MNRLLIFGPGYTASRFGRAAEARGWKVYRVDRARMADLSGTFAAIGRATHLLSSVPPEGEGDPVLARYGPAIAAAAGLRWVGYLSSTGVYGDSGGAWVDEGAPLLGRRGGRLAADRLWAAIHGDARVFRLPGIYGPGRSTLERVLEGRAHRVDLAEQVFSRIHVDDIVSALLASTQDGPAGTYNLADDLPAPQAAVVEEACRLLAVPPPAPVPLDTLSPAAAAFYGENRRVAPAKARRLLGWRPRFATYRAGLRDCRAKMSPANTSAAPAALSTDQA